MRVSGLDSNGDWRFGKGKSVYLQRSEAIAQNVKTRVKSFVDDWFADINDGIDWFNLLGNKGTENQILREVENRILQTFGVRSIESIDIVEITTGRVASIQISYRDIFDTFIDDQVEIPL